MNSLAYRRRVYDFIEMGSFGGRMGALFEASMVILICLNVLFVALETVDTIWEQYEVWFNRFELFSVLIFTVEYITRLWVSVEREDDESGKSNFFKRLGYIFTPLAILDLLAILPFYLIMFAVPDMRFLRIFRLVRLLKLVRYSPALMSLARVIYEERRALLATLLVMVGLLLFAASMMYFIEKDVQPEHFGSIPAALWWAIATLTTVGYGDVVPITTEGKMIGGLVMIFGLAFFAIPIGILASGFSSEVHRREFIVPTGAIRGVPIFKSLSTEALSEISKRIRTLRINAGTVISNRRDQDNGLFIVVSGEVSVFYHHRSISLTAGDHFGEISLIIEDGQQPTVVARTHCRILRLESQDLHMLFSVYPEVAKNILGVSIKRLTELVEDGHLSFMDRDEIQSRIEAWVPPSHLD